tara:strand:- start:670 stop:1284 length:615 start_codon:yes stop_codon:yes gene_type:complete
VELDTFVAFVIATTIMILLPGPSVMLTIGHSISHGTRAAFITVAGTSTAIIVQLIVTAAGKTSLLLVLADWFEVIRWLGVAYLIYVGVQYWHLNEESDAAVSQTGRGHRLFWQGFVVSATNPKSLAFYAAFFPQFIRVGADITEQLLILCVTFFVIASFLTAGYAVLAGNVRRYVTGAATAKVRNRISGTLVIGAGLGLALVRR